MLKAAAGTAVLAVSAAAVAVIRYRIQYEPFPDDAVADGILVEKAARRLTLLRAGQPLKSYRVALGPAPVGHKEFEGDGKTPEGRYTIDFHTKDSAFHLALHVSYPREADRAHATALGRDPGGAIMIHGLRNGLGFIGPLHRTSDWTQGCIAVTNAEIEEIWRAVPDGTPIQIRP